MKLFWEKLTEAPNSSYIADGVGWMCYECGNTESFKILRYWEGDIDVQCHKCDSVETGEEVLSYKENEDV